MVVTLHGSCLSVPISMMPGMLDTGDTMLAAQQSSTWWWAGVVSRRWAGVLVWW